MAWRTKLLRIVVAFLISIGFNALVFLTGTSRPYGQEPFFGRAYDFLSRPCTYICELFVTPSGHTGAELVPVVVALVVYYTGVAWVILRLAAWLRSSRRHRG